MNPSKGSRLEMLVLDVRQRPGILRLWDRVSLLFRVQAVYTWTGKLPIQCAFLPWVGNRCFHLGTSVRIRHCEARISHCWSGIQDDSFPTLGSCTYLGSTRAVLWPLSRETSRWIHPESVAHNLHCGDRRTLLPWGIRESYVPTSERHRSAQSFRQQHGSQRH